MLYKAVVCCGWWWTYAPPMKVRVGKKVQVNIGKVVRRKSGAVRVSLPAWMSWIRSSQKKKLIVNAKWPKEILFLFIFLITMKIKIENWKYDYSKQHTHTSIHFAACTFNLILFFHHFSTYLFSIFLFLVSAFHLSLFFFFFITSSRSFSFLCTSTP